MIRTVDSETFMVCRCLLLTVASLELQCGWNCNVVLCTLTYILSIALTRFTGMAWRSEVECCRRKQLISINEPNLQDRCSAKYLIRRSSCQIRGMWSRYLISGLDTTQVNLGAYKATMQIPLLCCAKHLLISGCAQHM